MRPLRAKIALNLVEGLAMTPPWKAHLDGLRIKSLGEVFPTPHPIIGMVHCWPMPGAPGYTGYGVQAIVEHALRDAESLAEGGCDGLIVLRIRCDAVGPLVHGSQPLT